jgi:hypothetical protein
MIKMSIIDRVKALLDKQRRKGIEKYNMTLDQNDASITERINHLQEELADALQYSEWIKEELAKVEFRGYKQGLIDMSLSVSPQQQLTGADVHFMTIKLTKSKLASYND